ncbi:MAG TPA: OmpA family protein, partial [Acidobacteriota bacterium]|nr:OmpA family protein [Acidobacteriota bacterium]
VNDPDDDTLSITWQASGGKLDQQDGTAVLDTTGLEPGRYSVKAEVSDGDNVASCSADITVEKRKLPPTITCQPSSVSVTEGDSVTLNAQASDPNDDPLTYSWTVNGQSITNNSPSFEFGTEGRSPGQYKVEVTVTDVDNMSASCEFTVTVEERPNRPPTVSLQVNPTEVFAGQTVTATATANDPDGDSLNYSWSVDGQSRPGSGSQLTIDTSGMTGGSHSVSVTVNDGRGGTASDTQSFSVTEKIIIPVNRIEPDNKAKAQLDEIALKLQQNPQLRARITGHTDDRGSEEANQRVGQRRADAAKNYLVQQHNIDESRIEATSAGESSPIGDNTTEEGRRQNRRVEVELFVQ